eukprot:g18621.t2
MGPAGIMKLLFGLILALVARTASTCCVGPGCDGCVQMSNVTITRPCPCPEVKYGIDHGITIGFTLTNECESVEIELELGFGTQIVAITHPVWAYYAPGVTTVHFSHHTNIVLGQQHFEIELLTCEPEDLQVITFNYYDSAGNDVDDGCLLDAIDLFRSSDDTCTPVPTPAPTRVVEPTPEPTCPPYPTPAPTSDCTCAPTPAPGHCLAIWCYDEIYGVQWVIEDLHICCPLECCEYDDFEECCYREPPIPACWTPGVSVPCYW